MDGSEEARDSATVIQVRNLTRRFAGTIAVNDISFEVKRGDVLGFLGPNGAGKTTTLRVLTGYLAATAGEVRVAGFDVFRDSLEVRKRIGYLPENVPLYPDMRVNEYLAYRAELKGVRGRQIRVKLREVTELCGLGGTGKRIIGQLSRGFRQRVGLADALIHDPEVLILDEPTVGLDPNQVRQIRTLIKDLASRHTILLSTHILSEVEKTCKRVLIINEGRIAASDTTENLYSMMRGGTSVIAEIQGPSDAILKSIRSLEGVDDIVSQVLGGWVRLSVSTSDGMNVRARLFEQVMAGGWKLRELREDRSGLEDIFVALTRGGDTEMYAIAEEEAE